MPAVASRGRGRRTINEINMVPFIDVMLVLLIIFMVTAPLITPSMIDLPTVGRGNVPPKVLVQVQIAKDETLQVKNNAQTGTTAQVSIDDVLAAVKQKQGGNDDSPVVIAADKTVKYETVVKVMDKLKRGGIERVGLSVQVVP